jgi:peptidoglycan hydrolase-like protein with peptidoglycan-binding domain
LPTSVRSTLAAFAASALVAGSAIAVVAPAAQATTHLGDRTLRSGLAGNDVKELQRSLTKVGLKVTADGQYGSGTAAAVSKFQKWVGLVSSGNAGTKTVTALAQKVQAGETVPASTSSTTGATTTKTTKTGGATTFDVNQDAADALPAGKATISNGIATAPAGAPQEVVDIIAAGNKIAKTPYIYGGGHGSFNDSGYDCSGSVSYALHGAGLLDEPMASGDFESWGKSGAGKWVTIWANGGHMYMYVAGIRFDTSGADPSRWQADKRSNSGFTQRHIAGL